MRQIINELAKKTLRGNLTAYWWLPLDSVSFSSIDEVSAGEDEKLYVNVLASSDPVIPTVMPPPLTFSTRRHSYPTIQTNHLSIEHLILDDVFGKRGIFVWLAQPGRERHLLTEGNSSGFGQSCQ